MQFFTQKFLKHFNIDFFYPSFDYLQKVTGSFSKIPYENLTKISKRNFSADLRLRFPDEVFSDFVLYGMGGTCFSLGFFLNSLLLDIGFVSEIIMGDRSYGENTHCAVIVHLDDLHYLIDPGFQIYQPTPISFLENELFFATLFNKIKLKSDVNGFDLSTIDQSGEKWRVRFKCASVSSENFIKYWHQSFDNAAFDSKILTKTDGNRLYYWHNGYLRITSSDGILKKKLNSLDEIATLFSLNPSHFSRIFFS